MTKNFIFTIEKTEHGAYTKVVAKFPTIVYPIIIKPREDERQQLKLGLLEIKQKLIQEILEADFE